MRILNKHFVNGFYFVVNPIGEILEAIHVHPHVITITGLVFSFVAGGLFWTGHFISGGIMIILSGACDVRRSEHCGFTLSRAVRFSDQPRSH